jgi:hypothetical protein
MKQWYGETFASSVFNSARGWCQSGLLKDKMYLNAKYRFLILRPKLNFVRPNLLRKPTGSSFSTSPHDLAFAKISSSTSNRVE